MIAGHVTLADAINGERRMFIVSIRFFFALHAGSCLSGRLPMRDLPLWRKARKEISISGVNERESLI